MDIVRFQYLIDDLSKKGKFSFTISTGFDKKKVYKITVKNKTLVSSDGFEEMLHSLENYVETHTTQGSAIEPDIKTTLQQLAEISVGDPERLPKYFETVVKPTKYPFFLFEGHIYKISKHSYTSKKFYKTGFTESWLNGEEIKKAV